MKVLEEVKRMIYNKKEFEKKLIDNDLNRKKLAERIGMNVNTLRLKLENENSDFKIKEVERIANELNLTNEEVMEIFFGRKLSFNESLLKTG